ncbi:2-C-methyl-D-erythritol 4-phosphate cytidylyltransferase [Desulfonema magnum]|uniref:2-C-methyl-D-erythritol 4-phosphate cytidylyltransferase n=1 Tax=Desulfonema magnum TaxID=45655 RepID=A0A975BH19_9BACT|nr:2-C-methyl-D-erythritol 4-phosphate cytidylyltransferase [Desulfonema magnum]QTA85074.1 2-C-methyl-D-erythritol 4-phosphate cytidylyltransferase [Desulfonema magnum]
MTSAIIVAGGKGLRMKEMVRKQYLLLAGRPILSHTLAVFDQCDAIDKIFLVAPAEDFDFCRKNLLGSFHFEKKITLVPGGAERQYSVYNGLMAVSDKKSIVVIHDGVRPFVRHDQITACIESAKEHGACILGMPAFDTLKQVNSSGEIEKTLEREVIWLAQTPQAFQYDIIVSAHEAAAREGYIGTDDASLAERMGQKVKIITGSRNNIKITTQEDLRLAGIIMEKRLL